VGTKPSRRHLKVIVSRMRRIGNSAVPIPFPGLGVIIDIDFIILPGKDGPSLLSLNDMRRIQLGIDVLNG
jgi:hypothetical protein